MKSLRLGLWCAVGSAFFLGSWNSPAQSTNKMPQVVDLPTVLRLAGARNLDIQIARERLREADANRSSAVEQFFPWLSPGVSYHRRDGLAQSVPSGVISTADYQSYSPGATLGAQMDLGDAIYKSLAARQLLKASDQALEAQRQDSALSAAQSYFDLAKAAILADVTQEARKTSQDFQQQLHVAVASGIAFKGDELRVQSQTERYDIALQKALEQRRVAAADLARILHLDATVDLVPADKELLPLPLIATNAALDTLVFQALKSRPEIKRNQARIAAARATKNGAVYGPLVPSIGAQAFGGGLGGGPDHGPNTFGGETDVSVGIGWKIGAGGLFDSGRVNASKAQMAITELDGEKLRDDVTAQVVTAYVRVQSLANQIAMAGRNLATASETWQLTRDRKQYGVGIVLEDIQAQQDLNQARSDYFTAVAEFNKAQYNLSKAVGDSADHLETNLH